MRATCVLAMTMLTPLVIVGPAAGVLPNGAFEGDYSADGVAPGWVNDSYTNWGDLRGDAEVEFGRETEDPRVGEACQRITVHRLGYISPERTGSAAGFAAAQLTSAEPVTVRRNSIYRVRAWLRADRPIQVTVQIREHRPPWRPHVLDSIIATDQWQKLEYRFTAGSSDDNARFIVRFSQLGTVWLDDVAFEELTLEQARADVPTPRPGNLLHNGNFNLELANWLGSVGWSGYDDTRQELTDGEDGGWALKATRGLMGVHVVSDVVPISEGYPLTVTCRIRAEKPVKVTFGAYRQGREHAQYAYCSTTAEVGTEWQTLTASAQAYFAPRAGHAFVRLLSDEPATIYLDRVELRQDADAPGEDPPRAAIITDRHPLALYHDGDDVRLRLLCDVPEGAEDTRFSWRLEDYYGDRVLEGTWQPGAGVSKMLVPLDGPARGWYRAVVEWEHAGRVLSNESAFVLLPPASRTGDLDTSPFGAHFMAGPGHLQLARAVGARWLRLWPPHYTLWRTVEPEQGQWEFHDGAIHLLARRQGLRILGLLERPPQWASRNAPDFWENWENYVARVVERHRDDIRWWEVQNEPDLQFWLSKPEGPTRADSHFDHLRHSYEPAKRANPEAIIIGGSVAGCFFRGTDKEAFTFELLETGALEHMDAFSFHYYHGWAALQPLDELEEPIAEAVSKLRTRMREHGKVVPVINTEGGVHNPRSCLSYRPTAPDNINPVPAEDVARLLVRMYVSQIAAGVERFFYYNFYVTSTPVTKLWDSFIEGDGQPRPAVAAYAVMTWLLDGAVYRATDRPSEDVWIHRFDTPRGALAVAWTRTGTTAEHVFPGAGSAWDIMGKEQSPGPDGRLLLSPLPTYILLD